MSARDPDLSAQPLPGCGPILPPHGTTAPPLRQQVFEAVRSHGQMSRIDVAKHLDVSPASVSTLVSDLINAGLLCEVEAPREPGGRGRPPVALAVRPEAAFVAGIKLSDVFHTGVIIDFAGQVVAEARLHRQSLRSEFDLLVEEAEELLTRMLVEAGMERSQLSAIGLGVPGIVDHPRGVALWSPIIRGTELPIAERMTERLGVPVQVDNDANMVTLAELWYGGGRRLADFAVVTLEYGVGMGLVIDHKLYRGAHSVGMELGHIKVQLDGALCRCGQRGCLEAYVSDYALVREASVALDLHRTSSDSAQVILESLYDQAKAGNEAARTIFRRAGRFLAAGLANVVNLFDPSLVILSGARMKYDYLYAEEVLTEARAMTLNKARTLPRMETNAWGDLVWARGAATLALAAVTEKRAGESGG
ncbi:ROK family transcriptional regulator [Aliiruegeria lutimaris]|uniref:Sugar kinase of the NBD/HSP70 family, may contain an N-terminal HTH domain n=1 Tax=Aliiruegeria lutimaris TaxID=571298 RepID=A0A1G8IWN3_9RHOB|nr:ROK family transcriptional regulator [Aliiruegeria lutimaris]SDI23222.1 Sugar kinase of the NBD/HSP70 family, may contain an N-terminal HTH domain [Aliiruegeria lutimaris]